MVKNQTKNSQKRRLNLRSRKNKFIAIIALFAVVGGIIMVFRSFAATATYVYYVDNGSMVPDQASTTSPCKATKVVDSSKNNSTILNLACSADGTVSAKVNNGSITSDMVNKYYRMCANVKGSGNFTITTTLPSVPAAQTKSATFTATGSGYGYYCTPEIAVNSTGTVMGSVTASKSGTFINVGFLALEQQTAKTYVNQIKPATADPGVLAYNGKYYMVSTAGNAKFDIYISSDLVTWSATGSSVFDGTHPWGKDRFWAPEIHQIGSKFVVYYSAGNGSTLAVGVATADKITGPYKDLGKPLVINASYGVIDANFFRDEDGKQYLYYKEDSGNTRIFAQELNAAGTALVGSPVAVLQKGLAWEGAKGIEAPWVVKRNGEYFMFYSGELYSSDKYAIGVAKSTGPKTAFTKAPSPILTSGVRFKGPGHNSVVSLANSDYMVYHAWDGVTGVGERVGLVDKITWLNGWPSVGSGKPSEVPLIYPN